MFANLVACALGAVAVGLSPDFAPPVTVPVVGKVASADFNGDGFSDLAVAGNSLSILIARGDGGFHPPVVYGPAQTRPAACIKCADFNRDGRVDIVTDERLFFGGGDGTFSAGTQWGDIWDPTDLLIGDVNGDGAPDVIRVTMFNAELMEFHFTTYLNDGDGGLEYFDDAWSIGGDYWSNWALQDVNGDGRLDLVYVEATLYVLFGYGDGTFNQFYLFWESDWGSTFGDFNGDGAMDVRGMTKFHAGGVAGIFNTFDAAPAHPLWSRWSADFNRDGNADIVSTAGDAAPGVLRIHLGGGDGSLGAHRNYLIDQNAYFDIWGRTAGGDFNGDGHVDIAVGSSIGEVVVFINDRDWTTPVRPKITIPDVSVQEGFEGERIAKFLVWLNSSSASPVSVKYNVVAGTATAGTDYRPVSGTLEFGPGEIVKEVDVAVFGEYLFEPDETFTVVLSDPVNADIADGSALGTILNDDDPPPPNQINIANDVFKREGHGGVVKFKFEVTLANPSGQAVTVSYRTVDDTAKTSDGDYTRATGTLTFSPGQTTKTVTVEVRGDRKREPDENFFLELVDPSSNATLGFGYRAGVILNDD
ncbi:MAG TPA: Calx-beta domain-containing protein [Planctomycetia bacterium]|nr:Calx-beta domain-containing protein [Planctomycetia bacterium]